MDLGAFVQENKRWLVGAAIGALVWLIASSVINTVYDPGAVATSAKQLGAPTTAVYDDAALAAAQQEQQRLAEERRRLEAELAFVPADKYRRWAGSADQHLFLVGSDLKQAIAQAAADRDVVVSESDITWDVPAGVDEIRRVLFGLDVIDAIQSRLFAAHDRVRAQDPDAVGLVAVLALKLESRRGRRAGIRRPRGGSADVDLDDLIEQQTVAVKFQADEATIATFLESCRQSDRTVVVDRWQVRKPARPGEPCEVQGTLAAIAFKGEQP